MCGSDHYYIPPLDHIYYAPQPLKNDAREENAEIKFPRYNCFRDELTVFVYKLRLAETIKSMNYNDGNPGNMYNELIERIIQSTRDALGEIQIKWNETFEGMMIEKKDLY